VVHGIPTWSDSKTVEARSESYDNNFIHIGSAICSYPKYLFDVYAKRYSIPIRIELRYAHLQPQKGQVLGPATVAHAMAFGLKMARKPSIRVDGALGYLGSWAGALAMGSLVKNASKTSIYYRIISILLTSMRNVILLEHEILIPVKPVSKSEHVTQLPMCTNSCQRYVST
jgi:hypothetical protein